MKRNPDGTFAKGFKPTPEHLEKMKEGRQNKRALDSSDAKERFLLEHGFDPKNCPVDISNLSDMFLAGKANSISSYNAIMRRSPKYKDSWVPELVAGEPCPTCGGQGEKGLPSWLTLEKLDALIAIYHKELEKEKPAKEKYRISGTQLVNVKPEEEAPIEIPEVRTAQQLFNHQVRASHT